MLGTIMLNSSPSLVQRRSICFARKGEISPESPMPIDTQSTHLCCVRRCMTSIPTTITSSVLTGSVFFCLIADIGKLSDFDGLILWVDSGVNKLRLLACNAQDYGEKKSKQGIDERQNISRSKCDEYAQNQQYNDDGSEPILFTLLHK